MNRIEVTVRGRLYRVSGFPTIKTDRDCLVEVWVHGKKFLRLGTITSKPAHWRMLPFIGKMRHGVIEMAKQKEEGMCHERSPSQAHR